MDDNGSFDESTFNFYTNAAKKLNDSDDEDFPCLKGEKNHTEAEVPAIEQESEEVSIVLSKRRQKRQQRRQDVAPVKTQEKKQGRGRPRRAAALQSYQSFDSIDDDKMLTVVEINDDSPVHSSQGMNFRDLDEDEGHIVCSSNQTTENTLNNSLIDADLSISGIEDLEVDIVVKWKLQELKRFSLKKSDLMKEIFKKLSEAEGVPESQISLTYQGRQLSPYDTPKKLKASVIMLEGSVKAVNRTEREPEAADPNQIELKVSLKDKRDKLSIIIFRNEPLEGFMEKTANEMKVPLAKLRFEFDGEPLDKSETPESMDLDGGECIEVFVRP